MVALPDDLCRILTQIVVLTPRRRITPPGMRDTTESGKAVDYAFDCLGKTLNRQARGARRHSVSLKANTRQSSGGDRFADRV